MGKVKKGTEKGLQKWCMEMGEVRCGKYLMKFLDEEVRLANPYDVLSREFHTINKVRPWRTIGIIDLLINYRGKVYVIEIKYTPFNTQNFWSALKCLAYREYYKWQENRIGIQAGIFMPKKSIKLEHKIMASRLKIVIFGITKKEGKWEIEAINL